MEEGWALCHVYLAKDSFSSFLPLILNLLIIHTYVMSVDKNTQHLSIKNCSANSEQLYQPLTTESSE